jgi:hypothetical protein
MSILPVNDIPVDLSNSVRRDATYVYSHSPYQEDPRPVLYLVYLVGGTVPITKIARSKCGNTTLIILYFANGTVQFFVNEDPILAVL